MATVVAPAVPVLEDVDPEDALELRVCLVMTGGVSLAVWMGGVTTELYRLVRREGMYGPLLDVLGARVTVDIIVGSSAGGLNGALLGVSLANNTSAQSFQALREVWLANGAMEKLLRSPFKSEPPSILDGDGVFLPRIADAIATLMAARRTDTSPADRDAPELQVLLTATTLVSEPQLFEDDFGDVLAEDSHRAIFRFTGTQLRDEAFAPRLALAARSTASFPGAFEASFCPVGETRNGRPDMGPVASFTKSRFAIDGGVLNNQPLDEAVKVMFAQPAKGTVRRIVAYVNPEPGSPPELHPDDADAIPTMASVVTKSLVTLPRVQSVARDLEELRRNNRQVEQQRTVRRQLLTGRDPLNPLSTGVDMLALAPQLYTLFKKWSYDRWLDDTIRQMLQRATGEAELQSAMRRLDWGLVREALQPARPTQFPAAFPDEDDLVSVEPKPWQWGIPPLEYGVSVLLELLGEAIAGIELDETAAGARAELRLLRNQAREVRARLNLMRDLDDAYWAVCLFRLAVAVSGAAVADDVVKPWASAAAAGWPLVADNELSAIDGQGGGRSVAHSYRAARDALLADPMLAGASAIDRSLALKTLENLGVQLAALFIGAQRPHSVSIGPLDHLTKAAWTDTKGMAPGELSPAEALRRVFALYVVQVALDPGLETREQPVKLLQVSANTQLAVDPTRARAKQKLAGIQLGHFGAFFKASWRANDWMWGRLDGIQRLLLVVLDVERLRQRAAQTGGGAAPIVAAITHLASGASLPEGDPARAHLTTVWRDRYADAVAAELAFLDDPTVRAPRGLPVTAEALAYRLQLEVLSTELPEVAASVVLSGEKETGAYATEAGIFVDMVEAKRPREGSFVVPLADCPDLLAACKVGAETVSGEVGGDLFTRTASRAAAVIATAGQGAQSGLGPLRLVMRQVRALVLAVYLIAQSATRQSRTGFAVTVMALAFGGSVIAVTLLGGDVPTVLLILAIVVLVVWVLLAAAVSGVFMTALFVLLPAGFVALSLVGRDRAVDLVTSSPTEPSWKSDLLTSRTWVAIVAAVLLAVLAYLARRRVPLAVVILAAALATAVWGDDFIRVVFSGELTPTKRWIIDRLGELHANKVAVLVLVIPGAAMLLQFVHRGVVERARRLVINRVGRLARR